MKLFEGNDPSWRYEVHLNDCPYVGDRVPECLEVDEGKGRGEECDAFSICRNAVLYAEEFEDK